MIEFPRDPQDSIPTSSVKIIGLGGAGANMLDRVALDGLDGAEMLALNTDIRTLSGSVASERIQLGRNLTKGLGTGGDPELGNQAVREAEDEIRAALKGRKIVFICVGLGGGTGSGAAPIVARVAREEGAFVVTFGTMPFIFEGRRRREQAETSLNELAVLSNALVTFDNGRMGELVLAKQGIHEAFAAADRMISESIKAVIRLVVRPGLINVGLDDLMTALKTTRSRCLFGSGIARGKDRAQKALRNALASPLLDQGALLEDAQSVLVHLCGGEDLTLFEIELLMESLSKHVQGDAHVLFGAAVDPTMEDQLSITLVSSLPEERLMVGNQPPKKKEEEPKKPLLAPTQGFEAEPQPEPEQPVAEAKPQPEPEPEQEAPVPESESPPFAQTETAAPATEEPPQDDFGAFVDPAPGVESVTHGDFADPGETDPVGDHSTPIFEVADDLAPREDFAEPGQASAESPDSDSPFAESGFEAEKKEPASDSRIKAKRTQASEGDLFQKKGQGELSFDGGPKGRFEGDEPSMADGEDLDVPAFLRKKRP